MDRFLGDLVLLVKDASHYPAKYILDEQFVFYSKRIEQNIVVPQGFVTDLASIPKDVLNVTGFIAHKAATIHDYLVRTWRLEKRKLADAIFYDAMIAEGVDEDIALLMYKAVDFLTDTLRTQAFLEQEERYIA